MSGISLGIRYDNGMSSYGMPIYDLAYFDIRICIGLWSVCCRFVMGLSSGLSVCYRLRFQHCVNDRFSIGAMSVIYRSQIGRFHTESYPKSHRHEPDWFYGVISNIVGVQQLADSLKILRVLSVSCRFGWCDWGILSNPAGNVAPRWVYQAILVEMTDKTLYGLRTTQRHKEIRGIFNSGI